jgi:hypothetical protein
MEWIRKGYGPLYLDKFDPNLNLYFDFGTHIWPSEKSIDVAIDLIRNKISSNFSPPYNLMVSGGIDSQAMLYAWHKSNTPFNAINFRYIGKNGEWYNEHDFENMTTFSKSYGINITQYDLSICRFLENELEIYAYRYNCTSPHICTYMKMCDLINGSIFFSGNIFSPQLRPGLDYTIYGLERYRQKSQREIVPFFFLYDADLTTSFFKYRTDKENYFGKVDIYHQGGFPVIPQQQKYTGFEKIKEYYDQFPNLVTNRERILYSRYPSRRIFDMVFRYRLTEHVKYKDPIVYDNLPKFT